MSSLWKLHRAGSPAAARFLLGQKRSTPLFLGRLLSTTTSNDPPPQLPPPPGPSTWESLRGVLGGKIRDPEFHKSLRAQYGDVVALRPTKLVLVYDPELFLTVLRSEWSLPYGATPDNWPLATYYNHRCPDNLPMMLKQGEGWKQPRHIIQSHMFSHKAANSFQPGISAVCDDVVEYLRANPVPEDLNHLMCNASFEMLAQILLDKRMGLLDGSSGAMEQKFVESAVEAFHQVGLLMFQPQISSNPSVLRLLLPSWRKLEASMDSVFDIGMAMLEESEGRENALMTQMEGSMERPERTVNLVTFLQAGVDTTANSLAWALYELARRPEVQEKLREELNNVLPPEGSYHHQHLANLPYLKAFARELHRYSPTAGGNLRRLPYDVNVGGYTVEKESMLVWSMAAYSNDKALLGGDPTVFDPERWLTTLPKDADPRTPVPNNDNNSNVPASPAPIMSHPVLAAPFGVGPRMCVGARIAQNEINTFVSHVCRNFRMSLDPPVQDVRSVSKLVNCPEPSPRIRFEPV